MSAISRLIDAGGKIGDAFPDGIPVIITRAAGLND